MNTMPDYSFEIQAKKNGYKVVCGIDEAGRGPWAGPVIAAAVVLDPALLSNDLLCQLDDSKKIKSKQRKAIFDKIKSKVIYGIGQASVEEIDNINILQATFLAMRRALRALNVVPDYALIDGNKLPGLICTSEAIVKGDGKSYTIAAASIIAKVTRDSDMAILSRQFPGYGWERNAGYGTKEHQVALLSLGVTSAHRKSYAPVRKILGQEGCKLPHMVLEIFPKSLI
jgi:ribonuclease HII